MVVQAHAILYSSMAISLLALSLVMLVVLCWFPECASANTRGPSIEHSQNRERKLFRINHTMESLPSMLRAALLLRGCVLSRYLLGTHPTILSVVISTTSFAAISYLYTIIVWVVFPIWSHQTPCVYNPRRLAHIPGLVHSVFSASVETSACRRLLSAVLDAWEEDHHPDESSTTGRPWGVVATLSYILLLPFSLLADAGRLSITIASPFIIFARGSFFRLWLGSEHRTAMLDLHCISWTLRTSQDLPTRLSALNYLKTITPAHPDTSTVVGSFDTLIGCIKVTDGKVTVVQGLEQLALVSALCCLHTFSCLTVMGMVVSVEDVRQRYTRAFPSEVNFNGLQFSAALGAIHTVFYQTNKVRGVPTNMSQMTLVTWQAQLPLRDHWWEDGKPSSDERVIIADALSGWVPRKAWRVQWGDYKPSSGEHVIVARALAKLARFEYRRRGQWKVPRWLLRFAFHSLSQYPLPLTSIIVDCLSIIAVDLGCDFSNIASSYERCVYS